MTTPEQERARVAGVYSAMSGEELRKIAQNADELSDAAYEALQAETARRDLPVSPPGVDVAELSDIVTLRQFRDLPEAYWQKGVSNRPALSRSWSMTT
jgi:hypothetical protein